jgi:hypothetical protein
LRLAALCGFACEIDCPQKSRRDGRIIESHP